MTSLNTVYEQVEEWRAKANAQARMTAQHRSEAEQLQRRLVEAKRLLRRLLRLAQRQPVGQAEAELFSDVARMLDA